MITAAKPIFVKVTTWYSLLSQRERLIVLAAVLFLPVFFIYNYILPPFIESLDESQSRLEQSYKDLQALPFVANRYNNLLLRQKELEALFAKSDISEGAFSYLEKLVKEKAGIAQGEFVINEESARPFGTRYERVPYKITFKITSHERLIDFLNAITKGDKPLVITSIDLNRSRIGDHIQVMLQISSVRNKESSNQG